jgi:hypothetical protein
MHIIFVDKAGKAITFTQDAELLAALLREELGPDTLVRTAPDAAPIRLGDTEEFRQSAAADWNRQDVAERRRVRRYRYLALAGLALGILVIVWVGAVNREPKAGGKLLADGLAYLLLAWLVSRVVAYWLDRPARSLITLVLVMVFLCWSAAQSLHLYRLHQDRWMTDLASRLSVERDQAQARFEQMARSVDLKPLSPDLLVDAGKLADTRARVARMRAAVMQYRGVLFGEIQHMSDAADINLHDPADRAEFDAGMAKGMRSEPFFGLLDAQVQRLDAVDALLEFCQQRLGGIRLKDGQLVFATAQDAARYQELLSASKEAARNEAALRAR